jgi:hypothetical protein
MFRLGQRNSVRVRLASVRAERVTDGNIAAMNPLSGVFDEAWRMYRAHALHLLAIAFVVYLIGAVIVGALALVGEFGSWLGLIVELVAEFLLQAALIKAVQDIRDGRADLSVSQTVSAAVPYLWPVAAASILAGIAIAIGLALIIVPGLILITIWAVIVPVIVIERSGPLAAFGRSQQLVRGHGWHVFGTLVLGYLLIFVVNLVIGAILAVLPLLWRNGVSAIVSGTLVAPYVALIVTLIYYRLTAAEGGWSGASAA